MSFESLTGLLGIDLSHIAFGSKIDNFVKDILKRVSGKVLIEVLLFFCICI